MIPRSAAPGNDMVLVTKHSLKYMDNAILEGLECSIKNISDKAIATLILECTFFDGEGGVVTVIKHKETNLLPSNSRGIMIAVPITGEAFKIQSYNVRVFRIIKTDVEKVQIVRSVMKAAGSEKEVTISC
jgi:hypothetical protein